jgi:hypothetical protein
MLDKPRLRTLYQLANRAVTEGVTGAFVECGTCNGGSGAILARVAARANRSLWLFDSFEGLPTPAPVDGKEAEGWAGRCLGQEGMVHEVLRRVGAETSSVNVVKGWFQDTLGLADVGKIALLHVDGDWYESVRTVLNTFYDRIDRRGFVVIDDYGRWPGCRRAVDEFFAARHLVPVLKSADHAGVAVWFQKPDSVA